MLQASTTTLIGFAMLGLCLVLLIWVIRLEIRLRGLLKGRDGKSLEDSIVGNKADIEKLNIFQREVINHFTNVEKRLNRSIQSVETLRFNPFKGTGDGGNQSFTTAMVNQNGSGVIISSMQSRDRVSIFSKPIEKFQSTFDLTPEETEVLESAQKKLK